MRNSLLPVAGIVALFIALFLCISVKAADPDARLLNALVWVESSRNEKAIGDNGKAVGLLQLHKIYVDDVNRILGIKKVLLCRSLESTEECRNDRSVFEALRSPVREDYR